MMSKEKAKLYTKGWINGGIAIAFGFIGRRLLDSWLIETSIQLKSFYLIAGLTSVLIFLIMALRLVKILFKTGILK